MKEIHAHDPIAHRVQHLHDHASRFRRIELDIKFNAAQLKTIQEVITLVVFCVFSVVYLKEELKWNYLAGFAMMVGAVFVIFKEW